MSVLQKSTTNSLFFFLNFLLIFLAFIIKLLMNWQKDIPVEPVKVSAESKDVEGIRDSDSNNCMEAEVSAAVDENNRGTF